MEDSSSSEGTISFDEPHLDHERAAYFIPRESDEGDSVVVDWPLRDEWESETRDREEFVEHYREFCESVPEELFDAPLEVVVQFAFNEYESLRSRRGAGHRYDGASVDRVSDIGAALRLMQKEYDVSLSGRTLDE